LSPPLFHAPLDLISSLRDFGAPHTRNALQLAMNRPALFDSCIAAAFKPRPSIAGITGTTRRRGAQVALSCAIGTLHRSHPACQLSLHMSRTAMLDADEIH